MRATEALYREHRMIEAVLSCLDAACEHAMSKPEPDLDTFRDCVLFFRSFADDRHHQKEEQDLFPLLERKGIANSGGAIGVMLSEHDTGRRHLRDMGRAIENAERNVPGSIDHLVAHSCLYVELLREHIEKEDQVLFPLADELLDADETAMLLDAFADDERLYLAHDPGDSVIALAESLCGQWGIAFPGVGSIAS